MRKFDSFMVTASQTEKNERKRDIGMAMADVLNKATGEHPTLKIESISVEMAGSYPKASILVSYEEEQSQETSTEPKRGPGRPKKE